MACEYICDGCGKRAEAGHNGLDWFKPSAWFERGDKDGIQTACSRACIDDIAKKSGKTGVVIPL
jgi:hypothetical protein